MKMTRTILTGIEHLCYKPGRRIVDWWTKGHYAGAGLRLPRGFAHPCQGGCWVGVSCPAAHTSLVIFRLHISSRYGRPKQLGKMLELRFSS